MPQVIIPYQSSHTKGGCITVFGPKNCSGFSGSNGTFIEYTFSANAFERYALLSTNTSIGGR